MLYFSEKLATFTELSRKRTMGRYQQWLCYRETEHELQAHLERLERELAQLQERIHDLEQNGQQPSTALQGDNPILQALAISLNGQQQSSPISTIDTPLPSPATQVPTSSPETGPNQPVETMSSALFAWGNLPNFGPQTLSPETT